MMQFRLRVDPVVVTSDDPMASVRIAQFGAGTSPWLIAVRMVSEGVDIPASASACTPRRRRPSCSSAKPSAFVRWRHGAKRHQAFLYIPDDVRLRARAIQIADERRHSLRKDDRVDEFVPSLDGELDDLVDPERQQSLFSMISAVATDADEPDARGTPTPS